MDGVCKIQLLSTKRALYPAVHRKITPPAGKLALYPAAHRKIPPPARKSALYPAIFMDSKRLCNESQGIW